MYNYKIIVQYLEMNVYRGFIPRVIMYSHYMQ